MSRTATRAALLAAAGLVGVAAVAPPLERIADSSFTAHMAQHLTLLFVVPLLALLARPFDLFATAAGKHATVRFVRATRALHVAALPPVALAVFVATLWLAHFSSLYESALENPIVHVGEHALFIAAGTLFWLPVLAPPPLRPLSYPARMLYLAVALPQAALLAMALGGARQPLYAHYATLNGAASALADQRNAAALMWIAGGMIVFAAFLFTLGVWARRESEDVPRYGVGAR